ncbi:MAG TPA: GNAT family N-acetyltransferase [Thermoanaerobacterales bacterium]|nr:GNAT family N-acetyltransferase [Thermoanaerobacterales bacterium]
MKIEEYLIREMVIEDYDEVYQLWSLTKGIGLSRADTKENIDAYLKRNKGLSFVCETGNRIIGVILCGHDGRRGFIHHLVIDEKYRQIGLGEKLVSKSLERLKQAGIQKCHLFVMKDNELGKEFWVKTGWVQREDIRTFSRNI